MNKDFDRKYTRNYKNFDEFCEYIKTPEEVMNWYKINQIKWNKLIDDEFYKKPINWPDVLLEKKEGNCFDHAIFMHYFCEKYNIENCIVRYIHYGALRDTGKWHFSHHFICILKLEAGWVAFEYNSLSYDNIAMYDDRNVKKSSLIGPFRTREEAAKFFTDFYMRRWEEYNSGIGIHWKYKEKIKPVTIFLNDKVMRIIDKLYGDRSFTQEEFYNLVKNEMGDTRYEGRNYEYAGFFDELGNDIIVGLNRMRNFREETNILEIEEGYNGEFKEVDFMGDVLTIGYNLNPDPNEREKLKKKHPDTYKEYKDENGNSTYEQAMLEAKTYWTQDQIYDKNNKHKFDSIKNFNQFCKEIATPEEALSYFIIEQVKWSSDEEFMSNDRPFYWPDDIIKNKVGVCLDQSIFMHYFYRYKRLENRMMHIIWNSEDTNKPLGTHAVPVFKRDNRYYASIYLPNYIGWIHGPFDSWNECAEATAECLADWAGNGNIRIYGIPEYLDDEFMEEIDKIYGRKDIKVYEWFSEDGYKRFRNSKALWFNYKNHAFWNPMVPVWKTIRWFRNRFGFDIPYFMLEETNMNTKKINEEVRMWGLEIRAMVNESIRLLEMSGSGGPMIGMEINDQSVQYSTPGQFIVTTKDKDSNIEYGVTNDIKSKYLYRKDKNKGYVKEDMDSYLDGKAYKLYRYIGDSNTWMCLLYDIQCNSYDEETTIYEDLTGRRQLSDDQIDFDENFRYYNIEQVLLESSILKATTKSKLDELKGKKTHLFDTDIKVSDKFSVAESVDGYCLRYGDYHSDFVSLEELGNIYNL